MKFQGLMLIFILVLGKTISMSVISGVGSNSGICCINDQCYTSCNGISCINDVCTGLNGEKLVPATPEQIQQANATLNAVLPVMNQIVGNVLGGVNTLVGNITKAVSGIGPAVSKFLNGIFSK